MYSKHICVGATFLLLTTSWMLAAHAATSKGHLQVKMQIGTACELTSGDKSVLDFGLHDTILKVVNASTGEGQGIEIRCTKGTPYTIGLDGGLNPTSPTPTDGPYRRMKSGTEFIPYLLLKTDGGVWGTGNFTVAGTGDGTVQKYTVRGATDGQREAPSAGTYVDTVTVELTY